MRWRPLRSDSSLISRSSGSRPGSTTFAVSSGVSRCAASRTAYCWWTTTVITRRRMAPCMAAVLEAARALNRRIVVAFQPHRFTRTASLMDDFGPALARADHIVLTDIYAAGEDPIPGVTIDALAGAVRRSVRAQVDVETRLDEVVAAIVRIARPGDVVI